MQYMSRLRRGFTLVELLLVIAILALLMFVTIQAISPDKQLGSARNAARRQDVNSIVNAVYQYLIDKNPMPSTIPVASFKEICKTGMTGSQCNNGVDLGVLTGVYINTIPVDPQKPATATGTNYWIQSNGINRITVLAPGAELGEAIFMTR
jgi:prepilin-type N-terminal cleavage/methylation domain-containing protein